MSWCELTWVSLFHGFVLVNGVFFMSCLLSVGMKEDEEKEEEEIGWRNIYGRGDSGEDNAQRRIYGKRG